MKCYIYQHFPKALVLLMLMAPFMVDGQAVKDSLRKNYTQKDYENFLQKEKQGMIPSGKGTVALLSVGDALVNNNTGATATGQFTQSETTVITYGSNILVGFNDAGSITGGANKFTGFSYSTDGGVTFTDGGTLPTNPGGDAGDPVLARNEGTGKVYFSTLGFNTSTIQVFRSDDGGLTWMPPINGTPGGSDEDKQWIAVDNFAGPGNGNVYLISRSFGSANGIYMYRSTDDGNTFGPNGGVQIVSGWQGAYVAVGPDHSVYAFWWQGASLQMRKSTDLGLTFGPAVTIVSGLAGAGNGDLLLTGVRQGTATEASFRSNSFPHAAINPVSGDIYVTFNDNPAGTDKGDIYMVMSSDGGATWSARVLVNDDGTTTDQWQPTIAVTPDGSGLGIFYYSRQEDNGNNLFHYYGRTGVISGSTVTFFPSFAISDAMSLPEFGRDDVINPTYMGDYNSASATPGFFHVVWSDNDADLTGGAPRKDPNVYYEKIPAGLLAGPNISVSPASLSFGSVVVSRSSTIQVTLSNIGDAPLTISSITSPGLDFALSAPVLPAVIPSLGSVTLDVSFTPLSLGAQSSAFDISSDALNAPDYSYSLAGTGVTNIHASPLAVDFGTVPVGTSVGPVSVTLENLGAGDLTISGISAPGGDFSVVHAPLPWTLPALGNASVDVYFSPLSTGPQTASFDVTSDAFDTPTISVDLSGEGIDAPVNDLCSNATPIDCGSSQDGTTVLATFDNVGTCGTSNTSPGVWYTVTGTGAPITVSTCSGASYDTKLSVFSGSCDALVCVGGNDDFSGCSLKSQVTFASVAGETYYILVHGFLTATGTFTLTVSSCPAEIAATPEELTFNLLPGATGTKSFTLSNVASPGALDLNWNINSSNVTSAGNKSMGGNKDGNVLYENPEPLYRITKEALLNIGTEITSINLMAKLQSMTVLPSLEKDAFLQNLVSALGEENVNAHHQVLFEESISWEEDMTMKGKESEEAPYGGNDPSIILSAGGPDAYGYEFIDSDEPDGPVFNWVDITGSGTLLSLGDDASALVPLPFVFNFYGNLKTEVRISSNGYLTFGTSGSTFTNSAIPNTANPNDIICPFWDDLNPSAGGTVHYLSSPTQLIVQYTGVPRFATTQPNTFQAILDADGSIVFQYLDMQGLLTSSTVGIENAAGTDGLQVVFNGAYVHDNLAVKIALPPPCSWISSVNPVSGTTPPGGDQQVDVSADATGLAPGTYLCQLTISSNAANNQKLNIPVTLYVDDTPPVITLKDPTTLWPPNHKYENIALDEMILSVEDDVDGSIPVSMVVIESASSDEPDDAPGNGDGVTVNDIVIAPDCKSVDLRKERAGTGNGRVYTVHVSVADAAGNVATSSYLVTVPHDQNSVAVDDGPDHVVYSNCSGSSSQSFIMAEGTTTVPADFELTNYPNPFTGSTNISFVLTKTEQTALKVYNALGEEVATLFDGIAEAGTRYTLEFRNDRQMKGIYYYQLRSGNEVNEMRKMISVK